MVSVAPNRALPDRRGEPRGHVGVRVQPGAGRKPAERHELPGDTVFGTADHARIVVRGRGPRFGDDHRVDAMLRERGIHLRKGNLNELQAASVAAVPIGPRDGCDLQHPLQAGNRDRLPVQFGCRVDRRRLRNEHEFRRLGRFGEQPRWCEKAKVDAAQMRLGDRGRVG